VDAFFPALDRIGERVEDLQEAVFQGRTQVQADLFLLRKDMVKVRRIAGRCATPWWCCSAATRACTPKRPGIYGMNFVHMPELQWRFGYAWALGLMVVSGVGLWLFFKRKNWL
jgi:Mg2+ and Co2+ transporter CorA